jgi:hypothetical protein
LWIESFLNYFADQDIDFACDCQVQLNPAMLPSRTRVLVLDNYS